jgi:diguanylate cyclase (GGDEF)-like protein/PAS domain S-box-containing protein
MVSRNWFSSISSEVWSAVGMVLVLATVFSIYVDAEKRIDRAHAQRHDSFVLADQLRQSSEDLTRMARTYVITGDVRYKKYFQAVIDIRDGRKPMPENYFYPYWDLEQGDAPPASSGGGKAIALLELMHQTGFVNDELRKLEEAKANSDQLARIETEAMALIENATGDRQAQRAAAIQMLHDARYHQARAAIMKPINEFFKMMDKRTAETIRIAERKAVLYRIVFGLSALAAIALLGYAHTSLRKSLGGSASEVRAHLIRIGQGDFSFPITVTPGMQNSVLANLSVTQLKLRSYEADRIAAEASLQAAADRLNEAQRIAQLGSWTLDLVSGELLWSNEVFRLFEIDADRFGATYEAFLNTIHPDDRDAVNQAYTNSLATRTPYEITHRLRMSDGRIKWVHERCVSDFDPAGKPLVSRGTVQDISRHRQAEEQLRIAAVAFESQHGMIVTDASNVILRVNKAFSDITGYTAEDAIGQTPRLFRSGRHNAEFYRDMWDGIRQTGGWQGEIWDRSKSGEEYLKWLTISTVKDAHGAVTHYVGAQYDITERKKAEEKIMRLAFFDQLTGLPNRTLLLDRLKQAMAASNRSNNHGALMFIDLDNFKTLNDTLGHEVGDQLLREAAQRLLQCVRDGDTVARLGGDEFVVVLLNMSQNQREAAASTENVAEKILATLKQSYHFGEVTHRCTASIGVTLFSETLVSADELMKQADLTMYKAKEAGRDKVRFFNPAMEIAVKERTALESELRRSLEAKRFLLHYQAQVVGDGRVTGAEVLVRWQHPARGLVSPAAFIPLAEETGLILPLSDWVLETACAQLAIWARQPAMAHLTLAVNVSAQQFGQPDFVERVLAVLRTTGADPDLLKLELTESLLVANVQEIIEKMFALKAKGVGFSLDDFGTGYSSLSYLKKLPLDQLKIDQSFVRDVLTDPNDAAIARTIVALARSLGLGVIAEGVETEAQRDFLADSGCHSYQGYFFSRPLALERFEEFMKKA